MSSKTEKCSTQFVEVRSEGVCVCALVKSKDLDELKGRALPLALWRKNQGLWVQGLPWNRLYGDTGNSKKMRLCGPIHLGECRGATYIAGRPESGRYTLVAHAFSAM